MFRKILIANRGEIAIRVIRACRELGVASVAVYSEADRDALHVQMADEAVYIGPAQANQSYLAIPAIVTAAKQADCDAIHPGYGFLSENPHFAEVCGTWGIKFIGPRAEAIRVMGVKDVARDAVRKHNVPVVPGSDGTVGDLDEALRIAEQIGYPVLIKASGGGGGRGIRIARTAEELTQALERAASEAGAAFGTSEVYIEKYLEVARHIEVQILADEFGNVIHLGERECSLQRRRQKLLEEAPSPVLDDDLRQRICDAAVAAARAVNYSSAGTCEFLMDDRTREFYFIEMNTRVQVEHAITEAITGIDIVKEQIRMAAGAPLRFRQEDIRLRGHALECRINAEDPDNRLFPSTGVISELRLPGGPWVRWDGMLYNGFKVAPFYDSLVGKLVVWAEDREEAIARMQRALGELTIEGIKTTVPVHQRVLAAEEFKLARFSTTWLEEFLGIKG